MSSERQSETREDVRFTDKMRAVDDMVGDLKTYLEGRYLLDQASFGEIAEEIYEVSGGKITVTRVAVWHWAKKLGIQTRNQPEAVTASWQDEEKRKARWQSRLGN